MCQEAEKLRGRPLGPVDKYRVSMIIRIIIIIMIIIITMIIFVIIIIIVTIIRQITSPSQSAPGEKEVPPATDHLGWGAEDPLLQGEDSQSVERVVPPGWAGVCLFVCWEGVTSTVSRHSFVCLIVVKRVLRQGWAWIQFIFYLFVCWETGTSRVAEVSLFGTNTGKAAGLSGSFFTREVPRVIRLSLGVQPSRTVWLSEEPAMGKMSRQTYGFSTVC